MIKNNIRKISIERVKALFGFAKRWNSEIILEFLFEHESNISMLVLSYEIGLNSNQRDKIFGYRIPVEIKGNFEKEALEILILLEGADVEPNDFEWLILPSVESSEDRPVGVIFHNGKSNQDAMVKKLELNYMSLLLQSTQNQRLADVMREVHKIIASPKIPLNECLQSVGQSIARVLSCTSVFFHDSNKSDKWQQILPKPASGTKEIELSIDDDVRKKNYDKKTLVTQYRVDGSNSNHETIHIPVEQRVYKLENMSIQESTHVKEKLELIEAGVVKFAFSNKRSTAYLQDTFSKSDIDVCKAVCDIIQEYASAKNFEENYSVVHSHLYKLTADYEHQPDNLLNILSTLSVAFKNVYIVNFDRETDTNNYLQKCAVKGMPLKQDYLNRIMTQYISTFDEYVIEDNHDGIFMGLDAYEDGFDFEFHLPGYHGKSRLYVIRYNGLEITESVFRAVVHLFRELYIRQRRIEHSIDRKSYLTQVRHVLIHHVSAANRSGEVLRRAWEKGHRFRYYWQTLQDDPVFPEIVDQCIWSLNQGALLLHNGGFLLEEINNINRKPIHLLDIINKIFRLFSYGREEKGIIVESKVSGTAPSVINGDGSLMSIVFMNLIDNSIKYSRHNKKIIWTLNYKSDKYIFSIRNDSPELSPGNTQDLIDNIERGYQKDQLNNRRGTGLGLPVANKILKAHSKTSALKIKSLKFDPEINSSSNSFSFEMPYLTGISNEK